MNLDQTQETKELIQDMNYAFKHRNPNAFESRALKLLKQSVREKIENE